MTAAKQETNAQTYDRLVALRDDLLAQVPGGAVKEAALAGADVLAAALAAHGAEDRRRFALREVEAALAEVAERIVAEVARERGVTPPRLQGEARTADELVHRANEAADAQERAQAARAERAERERRRQAAIEEIAAAKREYMAARGGDPTGFSPADHVSLKTMGDSNEPGAVGPLQLRGRTIAHAVVGEKS